MQYQPEKTLFLQGLGSWERKHLVTWEKECRTLKSNLELDSSGIPCGYKCLTSEVKCSDSEDRLPRFKSWFHDLLTLGSWASELISLYLSVFIFKTDINPESSAQEHYKDQVSWYIESPLNRAWYLLRLNKSVYLFSAAKWDVYMSHYRVTSFSLWRGLRGKVSYPKLKSRKRTPLLLPFVPWVESRGRTTSGQEETYHHWYSTAAPVAFHHSQGTAAGSVR